MNLSEVSEVVEAVNMLLKSEEVAKQATDLVESVKVFNKNTNLLEGIIKIIVKGREKQFEAYKHYMELGFSSDQAFELVLATVYSLKDISSKYNKK